ncbi:MAG: ribonuclease P protein component [Candidatus Omnitrophota bacterium]
MKIKHLLKAKDFADIMKNGKRIRGETLCLYELETSDADQAAVGVTVPKRFVPKAVTRNYVKRVVYAYFGRNKEKHDGNKKIVIRVHDTIKKNPRKIFARGIRKELDFLTKKG